MKPVEEKAKIVVVLGPTASGKTGLAVELAQEFDGEVISADSRQVYRGLDIGTEKVTKEEMGGVPHHLIDVCDPEDVYNAADFLRDANAAISDIINRGKLPIIAGGTYFYVAALLGKQQLAEVAPNEALRAELEKKDTDDLFGALLRLDPERAATIDKQNRRRLIRALEIVSALGEVPKASPSAPSASPTPYDALLIGIKTDREVLRARINTRLDETLKKGLVEETKKLLNDGVTKDRLNEIGLEYRIVLRHLEGELSESEMLIELQNKLWQYAKRQRTWLKRDSDIKWFGRDEVDGIQNTVQDFLN